MSRTNYLAICLKAAAWDPGLYCPDTYCDPDEVCKDLYDDLRLVFLEFARRSELPKLKHLKLSVPRRNGSWELEEVSPVGGVRYSSDFIGPSRHWAATANMDLRDIGTYLDWARELGGHIMWRKHACSVNQARGGGLGRGKNGKVLENPSGVIYDRMDLTLLELQDYMRNPLADPRQRVSKEALRRAFALDAAWFEQFKPHPGCTPEEWFASFISFWELESFVNNDGDPMSMVLNTSDDVRNRRGKAASTAEVVHTPAEEQEFLCRYKDYVANMKIAVEARTSIMVEVLEKARKRIAEQAS